MRTIPASKITGTVARLCLKANLELRPDVLRLLKAALRAERSPRAKRALEAIIENARQARLERLAICQDTGLPAVFIELGQDVRVRGSLEAAVNRGIERGYARGAFRPSIVADPLLRGRSRFTPGVLHLETGRGSRLKISVLPKGFGCENKSALRMLNPTADWRQVKEFVVSTVKSAGGDACPPYVVGVGIGGTAEHACLMAKKALLRPAGGKGKRERELLEELNRLGIGPMGFGGRTTCLGVNIESFPTHIAGLPVAVSISCHALRSASASI